MKKPMLVGAIAALVTAPAAIAAQAPSNEEMWQIIQQQSKEIERLKREQQTTDAKVEATAEALESNVTTANWTDRITLAGYGEHHFNHFKDGEDQIDAHRFVLFIGNQFTDTLRFFSEVEIEHGLVEDTEDGSGPGELELEQAYIEWSFAQNHRLSMGQFLVPVGIINETHEPVTWYGVERNSVESQIVPTTWWETGVMVSGEILPGLSYNAAVHSGLNMNPGDKVRDGRQKSAKATAESLAYTGRVSYTGVAGLELAATVHFQEDVTQGTAPEGEARLLEAHARYRIGGLTLTALAAKWDIDGAGFEANGRDVQEGHFVEASYMVTPKLGVFVRQSEWDNNAGISGDTDTDQTDLGVNYWLTSNVVIKADMVEQDGAADNDSFNLGLGWSF